MPRRDAHRVLCVDDDPLFLKALARVVRTVDGVTVDTAGSAEDAHQLIDDNDYAVLITDYSMPGDSGIDLLAHLAREHSDIVPVLTTAHVKLEVALEATNRGRAFAFLRKPVDNDDVVLTVSRAIERHELGQTLRDKIAELERINKLLRESRDEVLRLHKVASTDQKTGVRSYGFFKERLEEEIARAQRYGHALTLVLFDLDGFKAVNDRHGHVAGDEVLRRVAEVMAANIRKIDILARFGGDEFALLLPNTPLDGASVVCARLIERIASGGFAHVEPGAITLSAGIAALEQVPSGESEQLVELADRALYAAKRAGGDRLTLASSDQQTA